jgi:hypothetical protein
MKLSEKTISILQNFASINQSIFVKQGSTLRTISVMKNILAEAKVSETFPRDFAIYDLNQFLNGLKLYKDPELNFSNDSYLLIQEGNRKIKYFYADPSVIISPPDKNISLPSEDICFQLEHSILDKLIKASGVFQLFDLSAIGEGGVIRLVVRDKKNDTSNEYSVTVGETDVDFIFNFKAENIKIVPGTYDVVISSKQLSKFTNQNHDIEYFIALEPDSTFG